MFPQTASALLPLVRTARQSRLSTTLHLRFFYQQPSEETDQVSDKDKILLNPTAPLHPLLNTPSLHPGHLSHYTLPPLEIGKDDYRPDLEVGQRIVAFGDVHGDLSALHRFLIAAKVIDCPLQDIGNARWTGGSTILIQTGDILDRGARELECFRILCHLARQAEEFGGKVYVLYGNHESLNAAGLFQYADAEGNVEFERVFGERLDKNFGSNRWRLQFAGNEPARWAACEPGGLLAHGEGSMMENMCVACLIGRTVFVHGGLRVEHLNDENPLKTFDGIPRMNLQAREWIMKHHHGHNNNWGEYQSVQEVINAAQHRARVASKSMPDCLGGGIGASSPVWMRDYSQPNDAPPKPHAKDLMDKTLSAIGKDVHRMVMGHTPQYQINSALGGRAWRIDVGASAGVMSGTPEVLEIIHGEEEDEVSVLTLDGRRIGGRERGVVDNVLF